MLDSIKNIMKNVWFEDAKAPVLYINDTAMRIRAGILLFIPIFIGITLYDAIYASEYSVNESTIVDIYETNEESQMIYTAQIVKNPTEYETETYLLYYALFEMIAGMFVFTSRLSPLILLSTFLARNAHIVWKPLIPKRFAWSLGGSMVITCLIFLNPDSFAGFVNELFDSMILPTTYNYMSSNIPTPFVVLCIAFMWLEAVLGFCVGCKIHSLLVFFKIIDEACEYCDDITKVRR